MLCKRCAISDMLHMVHRGQWTTVEWSLQGTYPIDKLMYGTGVLKRAFSCHLTSSIVLKMSSLILSSLFASSIHMYLSRKCYKLIRNILKVFSKVDATFATVCNLYEVFFRSVLLACSKIIVLISWTFIITMFMIKT